MTWHDWLSIAEFIVVTLILVYEMKSVSIEQRSHSLYREYFESRKAWYAARSKKRADCGQDSGGSNLLPGGGDAPDSSPRSTAGPAASSKGP